MKRLLCYLLIFSSLFVLPGCWDASEIEDLGISTAIAVDRVSNGQIQVTLQILNPAHISPSGGGVGGGTGGKGAEYWNVSGTGDNISQALSKISDSLPKKLYLAQNNIIIIGEEMARSGFGNLIDYLIREPTTRLTNYVFVSRGKASDILSIPPNLEELPSDEIQESIYTIALKNTAPSQMKDVAACFIGPTSSFVTAKIEGIPRIPQQPADGNQTSQNNPEANKQINLQGLAVIKEGKLVDFLTQDESYGYMLITNKAPRIVFNVGCPGVENADVAIDVIRAVTKTNVKIENGRLIYNIGVKAEGNISEITGDLDVLNEKNIEIINKEVEKGLADRIKITIERAQDLDSDFLGFLPIFHRTYPKEYKIYKDSWNKIFPNVGFNIKVHYATRRYGVNTRSIQE